MNFLKKNPFLSEYTKDLFDKDPEFRGFLGENYLGRKTLKHT
jgi:hypothetical protein